MAGTATYNLAEGFALQTAIGRDVLRRPFQIDGLVNGPDPIALAVEALAVLPDKGTPVPAPLVGMIVDNADIDEIWQAGATWSCTGILVYRTPTRTTVGIGVPDKDGPGVTVSTQVATEEIETDLDRLGNQVATVFDNVAQVHTIRRQRPLVTHVFVRPEQENPRARRDTYQGKLNAVGWNGYAARTVLCQTISDTTNDNQSWEVEYVFVVRPEGWEVRVAHEDPVWPGKPLPEAGLSAPELADAFKAVELYDTVDFSGLNIDLA